jgi:guanine nucleotide-binding protein subunit alpha
VKTSFILFLNKADVCMVKIRDPAQQVKGNFPDFPGKPGSFNDCVDYFKGRFRALARTPNKEIYMHVTTAVDKENVRVVSYIRPIVGISQLTRRSWLLVKIRLFERCCPTWRYYRELW